MQTYQDYASSEIINWLLEGDPAVRWQVQRDLLDEPTNVYEAQQARVAEEGWGADYLARQDEDGLWGGGLYGPKWISTHYTLMNLRRLGLSPDNPQAIKGARILLDNGFLPDHGIRYVSNKHIGEPPEQWRKHAETCISGMCLSMFAYFDLEDERVHLLAAHMVGQQMEDQGWNCRSYRGDTHSSFHTSTMALEGLHEYHAKFPQAELPVAASLEAGREFLLQHRLYKSHRTGEIVNDAMTRFPFPSGWQHDVLKALDHFQAAGAARDQRARDAIELLLKKRNKEGSWNQYRGPSGRYFFEIEQAGKPGRMNTLRALRVLKWWFGG